MTTPEHGPRYARLAAGVLARRAAEDADATPGELPDRTEAVAAIERALRARGRRRVAPWLGWGVAAAAAALLVWVGWRGLATPHVPDTARAPAAPPRGSVLAIAEVDGAGASIETIDGTKPATRDDRIAAGASMIVPGEGQLVLALDTGTRLRLASSSRARVAELGTAQRFDLQSGTLAAEVVKLSTGDRFVIATPDAEVEVKGTRFEVAVVPAPSACAPFVRTQVFVREGVVAVRAGGTEVRVAAGSAWPVCAPPESPARTDHTRRVRTPVTPAAGVPRPLPAPDPSTLAEQNDLFAAALAARRRGDVGEAVRWLDRLIDRYPGGPLSENARAERQRLIEAGGGKAPRE